MHRLDLIRRLRADEITAANGLCRGRMPLLDFARRHEGCTQKEIADELHISPASVAVSARRMERDGLLLRETDGADQRCNRVRLTARGLRATEACRAGFDALDGEMFRDFSQDELETLERLIRRTLDNLSDARFRDESFGALVSMERERMRREEEQDD